MNTYEQRVFRPAFQPLDEQYNNRVTIGATGRMLSASLSRQVVCTAIVIDGEPFDLKKLKEYGTYSNGELHFNGEQQASFTVRAKSHIGFRFRTNNHSGIAFVAVNGAVKEHDLYIANEAAKFKQFDYWLLGPDGSFSVEMPLPRYPVHELEILSGYPEKPVQLIAAEIHGKEKVIDLLEGQQPLLGKIRFRDVLQGMRSFFHPVQFCWQILFALLSAWLLVSLIQRVYKTGELRNLFFAEKRYVFWVMFGSGIAVFGTWLAAFWPGVMSVDSLKIWRAAVLPDVFTNDHPFMNVILYKYLYHIWNDPAVVPVVQILLVVLLMSWFGFWLYQQGMPGMVLAFWFLFILCSVPIALYNLMLWKDIPFALLVVFWACLLTKLYRERRQGCLQWTWQRIFSLVLLGLSLVLIRHNGLVYLVVLPLLFLVLGLVPVKKVLTGFVALLLAGGVVFIGLHLAGKTAGTGFFSQKIRNYTGQLSLEGMAKDASWTMQKYMGVLNINQKEQKWDKFHYYFHDRYAWRFLQHSGWWDVYPYKKDTVQFPRLRKVAMQIYKKSYQEPWVRFSWNPVWLLGLLPILTLLFWWFPHTAILGTMLLAGSLPLVYLRIFNWRYYYFLYVGLLFLPAFASLDLCCRKKVVCVTK
ncbi:hypothetical protein [Candidatus Electrothrix sp.]|uniref:hypothetical protein n=1 Tax=Candidatus Electrothrix sp. TaxID=2170559 RepID=UPI0040563F0A